MFLESLIRLAEVMDHFKSKNEFLIDEKFHKETEDLIVHQTKFLLSDLEFKKENPGPYSFGFGDMEINLFSPDQTEEQEWAAIIRKGSEQRNYRFNSIMGLVKVLVMAIEDDKRDTKQSG